MSADASRFVPRPADVDGDGHADLLLGEGVLGARLLRGGAQGYGAEPLLRLESSVDAPSRLTAGALALADLDGDGRAELLAGEPRFEPRADGGCARGRLRSFSLPVGGRAALLHAELVAPEGFATLGEALLPLGDLDGDGAQEVLVRASRPELGERRTTRGDRAHWFCTPAYLLLRGGPTLRLQPIAPGILLPAVPVVGGRFDGDAQLDLLFASARLTLLRGTPTGFASEPLELLEEAADVVDLARGDFDGDGHDDVALALQSEGGLLARVLFGPLASGGRSVELRVAGEGRSAARARAVVALRGRAGEPDALLVEDDEHHLRIFAGGSAFARGAGVVLEGSFAEGGRLASAGDVDGDGREDVVALLPPGASAPWDAVLLGRSGEGFALRPVLRVEQPAQHPYALGGVGAVALEHAPEAPPVPRRCEVPSPETESARLVAVEVEAPAEDAAPVGARRGAALPEAARAALQRALEARRPALARCQAQWLASDCNHAGAQLRYYEASRAGAAEPRGRQGVLVPEEVDACLEAALGAVEVGAPPAGRSWGFVVRVRLLPGP